MEQNNKFIDTREAAESLRCSERHICRLFTGGKLKGTKIGGKWKIPLDSIQQYQAEQRELVLREAKILQLLKTYVLLHLSTVSGEAQEVGQEIIKLYSQPVLDDMTKTRVKELEEKLAGFSRYSGQIIRDLEAAEKLVLQ